MPDDTGTIFALSSGRPPSAIAIMRISGPAAAATLEALAGPLPAPRRATLRPLYDGDELLDRALVLWFPGPATATGEDLVELHLHGSRAVIDAMTTALTCHAGLRPAEAGEFTRRALLNGRIDLTEAEGLADLMIAETEVQRRAALSMAGGALSREVLVWREELLSVAALVEAQIDFSEESDVAAQDGGVGNRIAALASTLDRRLARPRIERLRDGIRVVLAGPPNAGKSSLLNALVDREAAIVSAEPGTTRDLIEVPVTIGGTPFLFLDTAGLREPGGDIERIGIARAEVAIAGADLILWLGDDEPPFAGEHVLRLFPRSDMQNRQAIPPGRLAVSSRTLAGLDELIWRLRETADHLLPSTSETALNRRQAEVLTMVARSLDRCADESDLILVAENLRAALLALDGLTGAAGVEDMLDRLFAGLCIGK